MASRSEFEPRVSGEKWSASSRPIWFRRQSDGEGANEDRLTWGYSCTEVELSCLLSTHLTKSANFQRHRHGESVLFTPACGQPSNIIFSSNNILLLITFIAQALFNPSRRFQAGCLIFINWFPNNSSASMVHTQNQTLDVETLWRNQRRHSKC